MWALRGKHNGEEFEQFALDVEYLKQFLTLVLRRGGSGYIFRES